MKPFLIFSLYLLCIASGHAQNKSCIITLSLHQCYNCVNLTHILSKSLVHIPTTIIYKEVSQHDADYFTKEVLHLSFAKSIVSDSMFRRFNAGNESMIHFIENGKEIGSYSMNDLNVIKAQLHTFVHPPQYTQIDSIPFPSEVKKMNTYYWYDGGNYSYFKDYYINRIQVFTPSFVPYHTVLPTDFSPIYLHDTLFKLTPNYASVKAYSQKIFPEINKSEIDFHQFYTDNDTLFILGGYNYVNVLQNDAKDTYTVHSSFFIAKVYQKQIVDILSINDTLPQDYELDNTFPFFKLKDVFVFSIFKEEESKESKENKVFAEFEWDKKHTFTFDSFLSLEYPKVLLDSGLIYEFNAMTFNKNGWISYYQVNTLYNLNSQKTIIIKDASLINGYNPPNIRFTIRDLHVSENDIYILIHYDKDYWVWKVNPITQVVSKKIKLPYPTTHIKGILGLSEKGDVVFVSKSDNIVTIKKQ